MELIFIIVIICLVLLMVHAQKWHGAYLKDKVEEKKYFDVYVRNLEEREDYVLSQQGFVSFVRFLFLLSLSGNFIKELFRRFHVRVKLARRYAINDVLYRLIREDKYR
jgi:hypothetical protein